MAGAETPPSPRSPLGMERSTTKDSMVTAPDLLGDLEPRLFRSAALHVCLHGCGRHWHEASDTAQVARLTTPTTRYEAFFSHDWGTSAWMKYFCLLIYYNSPAASFATALTSITLGTCASFDLIPGDAWMALFGYGVFFAFLLYWQQVRRCALKPVAVFLDKLCIPQDDEEEKARCIFGLSGFLDKADTLVVLWSPRYFCRLWCVYEIATWLKNRDPKPVVFVPVQISILFMICFVVSSGVMITTKVAEMTQSRQSDWSIDSVFFLIACNVAMASVLVPVCFYFWTRMLRDFSFLQRQLSSFRAQETSCHCCAVKHKDPATGNSIPCDRKLIYGVLKRWYGGGVSGRHYLDVFNDSVREHLALPIDGKLQDNTLLIKYLAEAGLASMCPWLATIIPVFIDITREGGIVPALRRVQAKVYMVLLILCMLHVSMLIGKAGVDLLGHLNHVRLACLQAFFGVLMALMLWFPFSLAVFMTDEESYLPVLPLCTLAVVDIYLYWPVWFSTTRDRSETTEGPRMQSISSVQSWESGQSSTSVAPVAPQKDEVQKSLDGVILEERGTADDEESVFET